MAKKTYQTLTIATNIIAMLNPCDTVANQNFHMSVSQNNPGRICPRLMAMTDIAPTAAPNGVLPTNDMLSRPASRTIEQYDASKNPIINGITAAAKVFVALFFSSLETISGTNMISMHPKANIIAI
jgi:hypothetical protein